ncbi:MAG: hypothetical protein AB7R55_01580 [Gemmatimonadales bacterium]
MTWATSRLVRSYGVARFRQPNVATPERNSGPVAGGAWDDTGLTGGQTYLYRVAAQYGDGSVGMADVSLTLPANPTVGRTPRAPAPILPPAPAPTLKGIDQVAESIWPELAFALPPETSAIRIMRQQPGGQPIMVTPTPVPVAQLQRGDLLYAHRWTDDTPQALGNYSYLVVAEFGDGRTSNSAWLWFTPQVPEASNVRAVQAGRYVAAIQFNDSPIPASKYLVFGSGLPSFGTEATSSIVQVAGAGPVRVWTVVMNNLAAGTYSWTVRTEFKPGIRSAGVPVTFTMP